jgi:hypothetical protein
VIAIPVGAINLTGGVAFPSVPAAAIAIGYIRLDDQHSAIGGSFRYGKPTGTLVNLNPHGGRIIKPGDV